MINYNDITKKCIGCGIVFGRRIDVNGKGKESMALFRVRTFCSKDCKKVNWHKRMAQIGQMYREIKYEQVHQH